MKLVVHSVSRIEMSGVPMWQVKYARYADESAPGAKAVKYASEPEGYHVHVFPPDTLEWRAAEYGIDPTDTDALLDIILGEPFAEQDPVPLLFTADTIEEARAQHTSRCAQAKLAKKISSRGIQNPLEMIRSDFRANPESLKQKRSAVRAARDEAKGRTNRG